METLFIHICTVIENKRERVHQDGTLNIHICTVLDLCTNIGSEFIKVAR